MKIRNGFVSNSSSSSFIVAFPGIPKSEEDVHMMMFGTDKPYTIHYYNLTANTDQIAKTIYQDIQRNGIANARYTRNEDNADLYYYGNNDDIMDAINRLKIKNPNAIIYDFEYFDDSPYESLLEQGNIFDRLDHIKFSNH